jgi:23S rRNA (uracil1939-C5)-methyltransferase
VRAKLDPSFARSVLVRANRAGDVQVTVVHDGPPPRLDLPFDRLFVQRHDAPGNRICSDEPEAQVAGDGPLVERYGSLDAEIPPTAFCQANPDVAEALYAAAAAALTGRRLAEFYCGAGVAGLLAARRTGTGTRLVGIDRSPRAVEIARRNAARNDIEAEYRAVSAEDFEGGPFDAVLVNPPRTGCHEAVLDRLVSARRVVYLSCNPATLARDIARLGFRCVSLRAADMLPQTPHLELLAVLEP